MLSAPSRVTALTPFTRSERHPSERIETIQTVVKSQRRGGPFFPIAAVAAKALAWLRSCAVYRGAHARSVRNLAWARVYCVGHNGVDESKAIHLTTRAYERLFDASPVHARWAQQGVERILFLDGSPHAAAFIAQGRQLILPLDLDDRFDVATVAMLLAHEAAHARLARAGFAAPYESLSAQVRVERRCAREQLDALRAVAPMHSSISWAETLAADERLASRIGLGNARRTLPFARRLKRIGIPRAGRRIAIGLRFL